MPENETSIAKSAASDNVDPAANALSEPIRLAAFLDTKYNNVNTTLKRTLEYAQNPSAYLESALGSDVFSKRRSLLCIPDTIDKDAYGAGSHKAHFENHIANLLGKEHGLFFITGIQAQLAAVRAYCDQANNRRVAWHVTSHLEWAEEEAHKHLYGLERSLIGSSPDENPTVEEIGEVLSLPEDQRPAVIVLEIPNRCIGCKTYSFDDLVTISAQCRNANVRLHCDGARLWEIEPYYRATAGKTFDDVGALFDSVYVSFYKSLGGAAGAMLASDHADLVQAAKLWQRRAGGNVFTLMYQLVDDERGFNENIGSFDEKWAKVAEIVEAVTGATARFRTPVGRRIVSFVPERPTCCQIHTKFEGFTPEELLAARDQVQEKTGIRVFERVRSKLTVIEPVQGERTEDTANIQAQALETVLDAKTELVEWMIANHTKGRDAQVYVDGYVALCEELAKI